MVSVKYEGRDPIGFLEQFPMQLRKYSTLKQLAGQPFLDDLLADPRYSEGMIQMDVNQNPQNESRRLTGLEAIKMEGSPETMIKKLPPSLRKEFERRYIPRRQGLEGKTRA